jgi:hypothetical protein
MRSRRPACLVCMPKVAADSTHRRFPPAHQAERAEPSVQKLVAQVTSASHSETAEGEGVVLTRYEIANIAGVVLGAVGFFGCLLITVFAFRVARHSASYSSRHFGRTMTRQYTAANIRLASVPGMGLGC